MEMNLRLRAKGEGRVVDSRRMDRGEYLSKRLGVWLQLAASNTRRWRRGVHKSIGEETNTKNKIPKLLASK